MNQAMTAQATKKLTMKPMASTVHCSLLIAVGSTLSVFPAANCVPRAKATGATIVIVNGGETAMDRYADVILTGAIGELLPAMIMP